MSQHLCYHCQIPLSYYGTEKLQCGETGLLTGSLGNLMSGSLTVQIYGCQSCGKLEFFQAHGRSPSTGGKGTIRCSNCGNVHDLSQPVCQRCGNKH